MAAVGLGRIRNFQREEVRVLAGRLSGHLDACAVGDGLRTLEPRDFRHRMRLQDALHDEDVTFLTDRRFLREPRWFTVGDSAFAERRVRDSLVGGLWMLRETLYHSFIPGIQTCSTRVTTRYRKISHVNHTYRAVTHRASIRGPCNVIRNNTGDLSIRNVQMEFGNGTQ